MSGQLVSNRGPTSERGSKVIWLWALLGIAVVLSVGLGIAWGLNPTDQFVAFLALLPLFMILVDVALAGQMFLQRMGMRILGVCAGSVLVHLLLWLWAQYLSRFDIFYHLQMQNEFNGIYEVRLGIAFLLGVVSLGAVGVSVYGVGVAGQLLGDFSIPIAPEAANNDDTLLSEEHIFKAQVLLNNLGYDVGGIDGELGPKTATALKQFQSVVGLAPEGVVTAMTLAELRRRDLQTEQLSWLQTAKTFSKYWLNRLMMFMQTQWLEVRNR